MFDTFSVTAAPNTDIKITFKSGAVDSTKAQKANDGATYETELDIDV